MPDIAQEVSDIERAQDQPEANADHQDDSIDFVPTTEFGRRLLELRRRIIATQGLLDDDGLKREIAERRGGLFVADGR